MISLAIALLAIVVASIYLFDVLFFFFFFFFLQTISYYNKTFLVDFDVNLERKKIFYFAFFL